MALAKTVVEPRLGNDISLDISLDKGNFGVLEDFITAICFIFRFALYWA